MGCEDHGQFDCDDGFEHWKAQLNVVLADLGSNTRQT